MTDSTPFIEIAPGRIIRKDDLRSVSLYLDREKPAVGYTMMDGDGDLVRLTTTGDIPGWWLMVMDTLGL